MMCGETLPEEKQCLKQTIDMVIKSIAKGEKKLIKLFKTNDTNSTKKHS